MASSIDDPNFVGYFISDGATVTNYCGTLGDLTTSGNAWGCYNTSSSSPLPQASCLQGDTYVLDSVTTTCTDSGDTCYSQTLFAQYPSVSPLTRILCRGQDFNNLVFYGQIAAPSYPVPTFTDSANLVAPSLAPITAAPSTSTSTHHKSSSSTSTSSSTSAPSSSSTSSPSSSSPPSKSDAWIAGAVVGPIVGVALIAGVTFWLWRRRKARGIRPSQAPQGTGPPVYASTDYKYQAAPMDSRDNAVELAATDRPLAELPTEHDR